MNDAVIAKEPYANNPEPATKCGKTCYYFFRMKGESRKQENRESGNRYMNFMSADTIWWSHGKKQNREAAGEILARRVRI